ncbi:hypothetical protein LTS02_009021, partial [Friedmanniomyces endolithicus]
ASIRISKAIPETHDLPGWYTGVSEYRGQAQQQQQHEQYSLHTILGEQHSLRAIIDDQYSRYTIVDQNAER